MAIHIHLARAAKPVRDATQPSVGEKVMCNGYPGIIRKVHTGQLSGMVDVKLESGTVTVEHSSLKPVRDAAPRKANFAIDDIAIGGTVIYKDGDTFRMSKAVSKTGMKVKLANGKEVSVGDVWSTDASDWNSFRDSKSKDAALKSSFGTAAEHQAEARKLKAAGNAEAAKHHERAASVLQQAEQEYKNSNRADEATKQHGVKQLLETAEKHVQAARGATKDSVESVEKEIRTQQRLIDVAKRMGKDVPGQVMQRMAFLKEELEKAKNPRTDSVKDASSIEARAEARFLESALVDLIRKSNELAIEFQQLPEGKTFKTFSQELRVLRGLLR